MEQVIRLSPVTTRRASEEICDQIRGMILRGELKPGDKLPSERAMMEMMQRSRPTIREALRILERAGLIQINAGCSGAVVLEPSIESLKQPLENVILLNSLSTREILEFKISNEASIAGWAAQRRSEDDLKSMEICLRKMEQDIPDLQSVMDSQAEFNTSLALASNNRLSGVMERVINTLGSEVLFEQSRRDSINKEEICRYICDEYSALYKAIEVKDNVGAQRIMQSFLECIYNLFL